MSGATSLHRLARHPDTPSEAIEGIDVALERDTHGLRLSYRLFGDAQRIAAAPPVPGAPPQRRDGLWRSTCCELFLEDAVDAGYREYNFAPNGDWAAYRFSGYRAGCAALETPAPRIVLERSPEAVSLTVKLTVGLAERLTGSVARGPAMSRAVNLGDLPTDELDDGQRIGLACVVKTDTELSYWALAHPPGKPDFHHASAFASTLAIACAANDGT